jgi:hypothetical protein
VKSRFYELPISNLDKLLGIMTAVALLHVTLYMQQDH